MKVILVDSDDTALGHMDKIEAHKKGILHRAFSVFIFNKKNELLIQKRSTDKYHSKGLWANTCCSHPIEYNSLINEAKSRLFDEMGFSCHIEEVFSFIYFARLDQDMIEHEYDHVLFGRYDKDPVPNEQEVNEWKWVNLHDLMKDIREKPEIYAPWLRACIQWVLDIMESEKRPKSSL